MSWTRKKTSSYRYCWTCCLHAGSKEKERAKEKEASKDSGFPCWWIFDGAVQQFWETNPNHFFGHAPRFGWAISPPKLPICIIKLVIVFYCNELLCVPMMVINSYCLFVLFWFFFIMSYCVMDVFCIYKLYIALHSQKRHAVQEKPQIDEVESRLRTAINLQETGALLKAIKLAKRWGSKLGDGEDRAMDLNGSQMTHIWEAGCDLMTIWFMFSWYMLIHGDTKSCNHWSILKYTRIQ